MRPNTTPHPATASPRSSGPPSRRRAGFTFIELMMVVLVIAIAAALVAPRIGDNTDSRLRAAAQLLAADLAFAQGESIAHGDDARLLIFDIPANTYRIAPASSPDTPLTDPNTKRPYLTTFGQGRAATLEGVSLHSISAAVPNQLRFGIYGQLEPADPASITIRCGNRYLTLAIEPDSGEVTISDVRDSP